MSCSFLLNETTHGLSSKISWSGSYDRSMEALAFLAAYDRTP